PTCYARSLHEALPIYEDEILDAERRTDGHHRAPAGLQLLQQLVGKLGDRRRDQHGVERLGFRPTAKAIAGAHADVRVAEVVQDRSEEHTSELQSPDQL